MPLLDRQTIIEALASLNQHLAERGERVVTEYFPAEPLPVRVRLLIEEMFDDRP